MVSRTVSQNLFLVSSLAILCSIVGYQSPAFADNLSENSRADNIALLTRVGQGLPGLDIDVRRVTEIVTHPSHKYQTRELVEKEGTRANLAAKLTEISTEADLGGSVLFFYTGHGKKNTIELQDGAFYSSDIRRALELGRSNLPAIEKLVMIFDSCYSGSLMDPLRQNLGFLNAAIESEKLADNLFGEFVGARDSRAYWNKLFVFASASPDETCLASPEGSYFTQAAYEAYEDVSALDGSLSDWVKESAKLTFGSHPTARYSPASVADERLQSK